MGWTTIRFAEIKNNNVGNTVQGILLAVSKYGLQGKKPHRKGFIFPKKYPGGIFFKFYKDVNNTTSVLSENNRDMSNEGYLSGELKSIFVFEEGYLAYELPKKGKSSGSELLSTIKSAWNKEFEHNNLYIQEITDFPYRSLKQFYKSAKEVNLITLTDIGTTKPNPHWPEEWMKELVEDLGKDAEKLDVSTGRRKKGTEKNLKRPKVINEGLMPISKPVHIRGKMEDGESFAIDVKGYLGSSLPEKNEEAKTDKFIRVCRKVIDGFLGDSE